MSVKRASHFLNKIMAVSIFAITAVIILAAVERLFHPFTPLLKSAGDWIKKTEQMMSVNSLMGISLGMIVLTVLVCMFPLFLPKVNKKQYRTSTVRGVIASVVFFFTQLMYAWAEQFGKLHLIGAMLLAIIVTVIIIEFLALLTRIDEEVSLRTDLLAAAASGLASGIVIKLIEIFVSQIH
jgi:hypothetical protein